MAFKSDKQRKAVMAKLNAGRLGRKNMTFSQAKDMGLITNPKGDADRDGVINKHDCKPFNPKKQGLLHDFQVRRLKKLEERLERKRQKEANKLEDLKDRLKERSAVTGKKASIKRLQLKQKQAIINQINKEKSRSAKLRAANQQARAELDKHTITGKLKRGAKAVVRIEAEGAKSLARTSVRVLDKTTNFLAKKLKENA